MTTAQQPAQAPRPQDDDTSYSPPRLTSISTTASVVSALFVALGVLGTAWVLYTIYQAMTPWGPHAGETILAIAPVMLIAILFILLCFGLSTVMRAISEAIFVFMDIEENTRPQARAA
jgi:Zn-dependent protease with chaperone function